ncbi:MAG: MBG domain-containing protein, partial [Coriobacteriales bacterium]|nr:MBG domain-containing protein [Coriobacteriales bacterium]
DADAVAGARSAYDALTEAQQSLVGSLAALQAAEARIAELSTPVLPLDGAVIEVSDQVYTGEELKPTITVTLNGTQLTEGTDYTVTYGSNINTGAAKVTISGMGNYTGTNETSFTINPKPVTVTANNKNKTYGSEDPDLTVTVKGTVGSDTVSYGIARTEGEDAGTYTITPTGEAKQGNYTVTFKSGTFTINPKPVEDLTVASISSRTYTGPAIKPSPAVKDDTKTLVKGTDFTLAYANNIKAGTASITVKGTGNYTGTKTVEFKIVAKSINAETVKVSSVSKQKWTGSQIKPSPTVTDGTKTLKSGTDYKLSYKSNVEPGTATIAITGRGNYKGTKSVTFKIGAKPGNWRQSGSKWRYVYADGTYPKNRFADIDSARYYFDGSGYMVTGWKQVSGSWYYFRSDGKMAVGWVKSGSHWCYLQPSGVDAGKMVKGWKTVDSARYYFDGSGYMVTGWKQISGKYYYFASSGAMVKSKWQGNYYLKANGTMAMDEWVDGGKYYVGPDGAWVKGQTR